MVNRHHVMKCYNRASGGCKTHAGFVIGGEFANSLGVSFVRMVNYAGREEYEYSVKKVLSGS